VLHLRENEDGAKQLIFLPQIRTAEEPNHFGRRPPLAPVNLATVMMFMSSTSIFAGSAVLSSLYMLYALTRKCIHPIAEVECNAPRLNSFISI